jgi:hypothetical protein
MFTLAARVVAAGQTFRVDEAPTMTAAVTIPFLARRVVERQAKRLKFAEARRGR